MRIGDGQYDGYHYERNEYPRRCDLNKLSEIVQRDTISSAKNCNCEGVGVCCCSMGGGSAAMGWEIPAAVCCFAGLASFLFAWKKE